MNPSSFTPDCFVPSISLSGRSSWENDRGLQLALSTLCTLSGEQHTPGLSLRMCALFLTHIGCQRTDKSPHEMDFYIFIGLDLEATSSYTELAEIQGIYHGGNTLFSRVNFSRYAHVKVEKRREKEAKPTLAQIKAFVSAGVSPSPPSEIKFSGTLAVGH